MTDNLNYRGPADRTRINIHEYWEVKYWADKWNITHEQLKDAVRTVGPMARDVAAYLGKAL